MIDATAPCAVCEVPIGVSMEVWNSLKVPIPLCEDCDDEVTFPVLMVIVKLKAQVAYLTSQIQVPAKA